MTAITPTPFVLTNCSVTIDGDTYEKAISRVEFVPSTSTQTFKAVSPGAVYQAAELAAWTADLEFAQDWADADSLSRKLFDDEGSAVTMLFDPIAGGATITATVYLTPGSIGGTGGAFATGSVSLPCSGKPTIGA